MSRTERIAWPVAAFGAVLLAWHFAAAATGSAALLPGPHGVWRAGVELAEDGSLLPYLLDSLARFGVGFGAAIATALPLGVLLGWTRRPWHAFDPVVQVLRPVSPIAWFPLLTLWFGIGDLPAVVIVFIAAFYPALLATVAAVRAIDPAYVKVACTFGESRFGTLWRVVVPAALPRMIGGARIAMAASWVFLVAGEMLGVRSGLGFLVVDARNSLRTDLVLVAIVLIGLSGLAVDRLIGLIESAVKRRWGA